MSLEDKVYWCFSHGIVMGTGSMVEKQDDEDLQVPIVRHAPFALDPFAYPESAFNKSIILSPIFNDLVHKISLDPFWLLDKLKLTGENDDFTARLMKILGYIIDNKVKQQQISLAINRSDYMQHDVADDPRNLLQVEINTISSSFGSLSNKLSDMQIAFDLGSSRIPGNNSIEGISRGIALAHRLFIEQNSEFVKSSKVIVVMIVQNGEKNFSDQRILQYQLLKQHGVEMVRKTFQNIHSSGRVADNGFLYLDNVLVSTVYYRAGYTPNDYESEFDWDARLLIERSLAVKCPNITTHLAGCKKIQQVLAEPGVLEYFLGKESPSIQLLKSVFAGIYSLDPLDTDTIDRDYQLSIRTKAIECPHQYVIKPQREGGGNNFYDDEVKHALSTFSPEALSAYIMMERIQPPSQPAKLIRDGHIIKVSALSELGTFGVYVHDGSKEVMNEYVGYLLRVKPYNANEGGVAAGFAVLGVPKLIS